MYDRRVTQAAISATNTDQGWELTPYSLSKIDSAIAHFQNLWDPNRQRLVRPLTAAEQRFITNERKLCALDFHYWLERYAWIVNWRKQPQRFTPNVAQQMVMDIWAADEADGNAILMQQLKARRLGVSTISELNVCHRYQFHPYSNCVVASADPNKTIEMAGMIKYALDQQPWWLLPQGDPKIKHGIPVAFPDIHTTLSIQAGNQFHGVARGSAPNVFHLSELCEWQDAEDIVDGALMRAVLDEPGTFGILESTALGIGNWWHRTWEQNKRDYARGTARVRPVFLPWYVGTDIYPTPTDLRKRPIPADWIPADRTITHAERAREYVLTNPLLFKYLARGDRNWQMPREQMWFREIEYETAREKKQLNIFLGEMCADDFEAFQSSNVPLLDAEVLIGYQERTRQPRACYTIVGPDIPPALVAPARQWDGSKPTITISTRDLLPRYDVKYQLIPLQFHGYDSFDEQLKLLVWEYPTDQHAFGVGVDCSEGVGQDNAVINVLREATPTRETGQVAEWAANTVTAFQLWPLVLAVGCWYSTDHRQTGERKQCRLAIETWTNGAACQAEIQKRGWTNFHPMYYAGDRKKPVRPGDVQRIGVITNQVLRANVQDWWMTCLKEEAIDIPSPYLVQEIVTLENVNGKAQAALDCHDDRWMALGFPLYSLHMNKPPAQQFQRKRVSYVPGLEEDAGVAYPIWRPGGQASANGGLPVQPLSARGDRKFGGFGRIINSRMPQGFR